MKKHHSTLTPRPSAILSAKCHPNPSPVCNLLYWAMLVIGHRVLLARDLIQALDTEISLLLCVESLLYFVMVLQLCLVPATLRQCTEHRR